MDALIPKPSLMATIEGKKYGDIKNFTLTGTVTNIYDGWSFELPNLDEGAGPLHADLLKADPHRWTPIMIHHSDPNVQNGRWIPMLRGVITQCDGDWGGGQPSTIRLSGFDMGKLLDSCGPLWKRLRGLTWGQLTSSCLDPSWMRKNRDDGWGFEDEVMGVDMDLTIKQGRYAVVQAYGVKYKDYVPPIQIQPGELIFDTWSRYARIMGYLPEGHGNGAVISVSATGQIQIYNPDTVAAMPATHSLTLAFDGSNHYVKKWGVRMSGEGLYSQYTGTGSLVLRPGDPNKRDSYDPNAGKLRPFTVKTAGTKVARHLTFNDGELWNSDQLRARVEWRRKMSEYQAWALALEVYGHSLPGIGQDKGTYVPITEGHIMEIEDKVGGFSGRYLMEQVTRSQTPATTSRITLRKLGLLGA